MDKHGNESDSIVYGVPAINTTELYNVGMKLRETLPMRKLQSSEFLARLKSFQNYMPLYTGIKNFFANSALDKMILTIGEIVKSKQDAVRDDVPEQLLTGIREAFDNRLASLYECSLPLKETGSIPESDISELLTNIKRMHPSIHEKHGYTDFYVVSSALYDLIDSMRNKIFKGDLERIFSNEEKLLRRCHKKKFINVKKKFINVYIEI